MKPTEEKAHHCQLARQQHQLKVTKCAPNVFSLPTLERNKLLPVVSKPFLAYGSPLIQACEYEPRKANECARHSNRLASVKRLH